jgi:hypothetical protein
MKGLCASPHAANPTRRLLLSRRSASLVSLFHVAGRLWREEKQQHMSRPGTTRLHAHVFCYAAARSKSGAYGGRMRVVRENAGIPSLTAYLPATWVPDNSRYVSLLRTLKKGGSTPLNWLSPNSSRCRAVCGKARPRKAEQTSSRPRDLRSGKLKGKGLLPTSSLLGAAYQGAQPGQHGVKLAREV